MRTESVGNHSVVFDILRLVDMPTSAFAITDGCQASDDAKQK